MVNSLNILAMQIFKLKYRLLLASLIILYINSSYAKNNSLNITNIAPIKFSFNSSLINKNFNFKLNKIHINDKLIPQENHLNPDFSSIINLIEPVIVKIYSSNNSLKKDNESSIGSGFIYDSEGHIITSAHVVKNYINIHVILSNDKSYNANIIALDPKTDIALIKIDEKNLTSAKLVSSSNLKIGNWVLVAGNPYGIGNSYSAGIISAISRNLNDSEMQEFIQTDATINNGNSGGPMFNIKGEVVGINSAILSPTGANVGLGFAIPSDVVIDVADQLKKSGKVQRGWIGVIVRDISSEIADAMNLESSKGAFINDVVKNSPADNAGLIASDVVLRINNIEIDNMRKLPKIIAKHKINEYANFTISRRGKIKNLKILVSPSPSEILNSNEIELDSDQSFNFLNISAISLTKDHKSYLNIAQNISAIMVTNVKDNSQAQLKGLKKGDLIISVNQNKISTIKDMNKAIKDAKNANNKLMMVVRRKNNNFLLILDLQ